MLLIRLCIRYPLIGIPCVLLFIAFLVYSNRTAVHAHQNRTIRRAVPVLDNQRRQQAVAQLQQYDPHFDEASLAERLRTAFLKIQHAWSIQDLSLLRQFVSDGIYERFALQIEEQRARGFRNHMEQVEVHDVTLAHVHTDHVFDVVTVRIRASAIDYRVSLEGNRYLEGSRSRSTFVEFWSLLRKRGVQTKTGQRGLIEGVCPNCGASLELNQFAQCQACESLLRSGEHDWVLAEITQECEWRPERSHAAWGWEAYREQHDPGLNLQQLEDRASVIFWRKVAADLQGDLAPLRKMATDTFCEQYAQKLRPGTDGIRFFQGDCAVGSVEIQGVLPAAALPASDEPRDLALVEVRWSGKRFQRTPQGRLVTERQAALHRTLFVLGRNPGVRTNTDASVSSAHCPGCGAPESNSAANACEYCGTVLNHGDRDWVLVEMEPIASPRAQALIRLAREQQSRAAQAPVAPTIPTAATPPEGTALLAWLIKTGLADKQIDERERRMLLQVAERHHIPVERFETMLAAAEAGELEVPEPEDRNQARRWLLAAADVSLADGRVGRREYDLLCEAGSRFGYSPHDVKLLLRQRHTELYREAKAAIRSAKQ